MNRNPRPVHWLAGLTMPVVQLNEDKSRRRHVYLPVTFWERLAFLITGIVYVGDDQPNGGA